MKMKNTCILFIIVLVVLGSCKERSEHLSKYDTATEETDSLPVDRPYKSFSEYMENPIVNNYVLESTFPSLEIVEDMNVIEVLKKLPKEKERKYKQEWLDALAKINQRSNSDISRIFDKQAINLRIYNSARLEANQIIERQNNIIRRKREHAPFWASIIIVFTPACDKYNEDKRKERLKIQEENDRILEKI